MEAVTGWALQGFMRCCVLSPSWGPPLLRCLEAEGPWRVVGAALNVNASTKQEQEQEQEHQQQQQQQRQADAARVAAAQHPQYELVNKYRRQLRRFLKVCCCRVVEPHTSQGT